MRVIRIVLISVFVLIIFSCEESIDPENISPVIEEIIVSPIAPTSNSSVTFNVIAVDKNADSLLYNWSCDVGNFSNSGIGNPINWYIEDVGEHLIFCTVSDLKDTVTDSVLVTVSQEVGSIIGFITDAVSSVLLPGVNVDISGISSTTMADGSFSISGIPTGFNQVLSTSKEGYSTYSALIDVYDSERTMNIELYKNTGSVSGVVIDAGSSYPLEAVVIEIGGISSASFVNGNYEISNVPNGDDQVITASLDGYVQYTNSVNIHGGEMIKNISLAKETGNLSGYVFDSATSGPISSVQISIEDRTSYSSTNGFYELNQIDVGEQIIWAIKDRYISFSDTIQVEAGEQSYDIYLTSE